VFFCLFGFVVMADGGIYGRVEIPAACQQSASQGVLLQQGNSGRLVRAGCGWRPGADYAMFLHIVAQYKEGFVPSNRALANFFFEIGMLKKTPRSGFQFLGSGAESVAEHSYRTAMVGYALARMTPEADTPKVVLMCLFHDVPEARIGDLNYVNKKYLQADEEKAVRDLAETLPFGDEYQATLAEFNDPQSTEAMLAHDADQLEMILSLKEYRDLGNRYADEWYSIARKRLRTALARELATTIWDTDSSMWWFDGKSDWWINARHTDE
jgi:putative hydrolase of HD superfamily